MAFDPGLAQRIREVLGDLPGLMEKRMFGGLAFLLDRKMFVGIVGSTLMARVGPDAHGAALARPHVRPMDFTGKPMRGYVYIDPAGLEEDRHLAAWVNQCAAFVGSLPEKTARPQKHVVRPDLT